MAASSCRRPRLRYSMTLASPCMLRIPDSSGRDRRPSIENVAKCAGATRGESPPAGGKRRLSKADLVARPAARAAAAGRRDRVVHDAADGARATAALGAAAEAAIDLPGAARRLLGADHRAHVVVAQHVARTDDHGGLAVLGGFSSLCNYRYMRRARQAKTKRRFCSYSNVRWTTRRRACLFCKRDSGIAMGSGQNETALRPRW